MKSRFILSLVGVFFASTAMAETINLPSCTETTDCIALGYNKTISTVGNCTNLLSCPFNTYYKKCADVKDSCVDFGYVLDTGSCSQKILCPSDARYIICDD